MSAITALFDHWRASLAHLHAWFSGLRARTRFFTAKAFLVFVAINWTCFWLAMLSAYPHLATGPKWLEYVLMSVPVAVLGAVFDIVSLAVTLWAIEHALKARRNEQYLAFLGIDLVIAIAAAMWVLFAFIVSGWLVGYVLPVGETLGDRVVLYEARLADLFRFPPTREAVKNAYFGMVMGASALIPTIIHAALALRAGARTTYEAVFKGACP